MFELLITVLCIGLCAKAFGLALRLTGGILRVIMFLLSLVLAPVLLIGSLLIGGAILLAPLGILLFAIWLCKSVLE